MSIRDRSGTGTVNAATRSTKVVAVRYTNPSSSIDTTTWASSGERIEILVSLFQTASGNNGNLGSYTNATEDLDINNGVGAYTDGTNAKLVFSNDDNAEFATLTYNWAINNRKSFLPRGFSYNGGYQPAIIKTTSASASSAQRNIVLTEDITDLQVGDIVFGTNIPVGAIIDTINTSTKTITISDNILAGGVSSGAKLSFTQLDNFGNEITKFDRPEIFGIIGGFEAGRINLVIDLNPSFEIDNTIRPYPSRNFSDYVAILVQLKDRFVSSPAAGALEDGAITIPYKYRGFRRITGFVSDRFVLLEVDPNAIGGSSDPLNPNTTATPYIDNAGIDSTLLAEFASYSALTIAGGGGKGTGFTANNITANNVTTAAGLKSLLDAAITNGGSGYNGFATVTLTATSGSGSGASFSVNRNAAGAITSFNVGGASISYNGTFTISIADRKGSVT